MALLRREDFWIDLMRERLSFYEEEKIAVTNARFPDELKMLLGEDFEHRHVMCSEETRKDRLQEEKYDGPSEDPMELPKTEQLAANLDRVASEDPVLIENHFRSSPIGKVSGWSVGRGFTMEGRNGDVVDLTEALPASVALGVAKGNAVVWNDPVVEPEFDKPTWSAISVRGSIVTGSTTGSHSLDHKLSLSDLR